MHSIVEIKIAYLIRNVYQFACEHELPSWRGIYMYVHRACELGLRGPQIVRMVQSLRGMWFYEL